MLGNPCMHVFFLVWTPSCERSPRYQHRTELSALREAERLAKLHPGKPFVVVKALSVSIEDQEITQRLCDCGDIPF